MSEGAAETVVVVEGDETPPESASPNDAPDVVVVDTGDGGGASDGELDLASRVGALEERVNRLEGDVSEAQLTADLADITAQNAAETADLAGTVAVEVADEVIESELGEEATDEEGESTPPEDDPPHRVHWSHRPVSDIFKRR